MSRDRCSTIDAYSLLGVFLIFCIAFIILCRVIYLQHNLTLKKEFSNTRLIDTIFLKPRRGDIFDRNGVLLSTDFIYYKVAFDPTVSSKKIFEKNIVALSDSLAVMFKSQGRTSKKWEAKIRRAIKQKNKYVLFSNHISYLDYQRMLHFPILDKGRNMGGFILESSQKNNQNRIKLMGVMASRTIGLLDRKSGIEYAYDKILSGKEGVQKVQKIGGGQQLPLSDKINRPAEDGKNIFLTIDIKMQDFAHNILQKQLQKYEAKYGCVVVMEVATGAVRAIVNLKRGFVRGKEMYYEARNYALSPAIEPGSTFKTASLLVAMEDKKIKINTLVNLQKGRYKVQNLWVTDAHYKAQKPIISIAKALEISSNVAVVKTIQKHYDKTPLKFIKGIEKLGLTKPLGIEIKGEASPIIPNPNDKKWSHISLEWMSYGYGIQITPIQLLAFYNAIANDGKMMKPKFLEKVATSVGKDSLISSTVLKEKIVSDKNIQKIKAMLYNVVKKGTAKNLYDPRFQMAGKTGTAQKYDPIEKQYSTEKYSASFVGFFPVVKPKYSCIVLIDTP